MSGELEEEKTVTAHQKMYGTQCPIQSQIQLCTFSYP